MPLSYEKQDIEKVRSALDKINETYNLQDKDFAEMFGITTATFSVLWKPGGNAKTYRRLVNKLIQDYEQTQLSYIVSEKGFEVETIERFEDIEKEIQHLKDLLVEKDLEIAELRSDVVSIRDIALSSNQMIELSKEYLEAVKAILPKRD